MSTLMIMSPTQIVFKEKRVLNMINECNIKSKKNSFISLKEYLEKKKNKEKIMNPSSN